MTKNISDYIHEKVYEDSAEAKVLRDFWYSTMNTRDYNYDAIVDAHALYIKDALYRLERKGILLLTYDPDDERRIKATMQLDREELKTLYCWLIYEKSEGEYAIDVQDKIFYELILRVSRLLGHSIKSNFCEHIEPWEYKDYLYFSNPVLTIFRLEYLQYISLQKLGSMSLNPKTNEWFLEFECALLAEEISWQTPMNKNWSDIVNNALSNKSSVNIKHAKDGFIVTTTTHFDSSYRMIDLQKQHPFANIETLSYNWKIQGYIVHSQRRIERLT